MAYQPNQIPLKERILCCVLSVILISYGIVGLVNDDLYIPRRHGGFHLHGFPMILMIIAMACASIAMLLVVIDHYDRRDNERYYRQVSLIVQGIAWSCFVVSLVMDSFWK